MTPDTPIHELPRVREALLSRAQEHQRAVPGTASSLADVIAWLCSDLDACNHVIAHLLGLGPFKESPWPVGESAPHMILDRDGWFLDHPNAQWFACGGWVDVLAPFTTQPQALAASHAIIRHLCLNPAEE